MISRCEQTLFSCHLNKQCLHDHKQSVLFTRHKETIILMMLGAFSISTSFHFIKEESRKGCGRLCKMWELVKNSKPQREQFNEENFTLG